MLSLLARTETRRMMSIDGYRASRRAITRRGRTHIADLANMGSKLVRDLEAIGVRTRGDLEKSSGVVSLSLAQRSSTPICRPSAW